MKRPVGRPRDPVTDEDVAAWFTAELKDLYRRHTILLDHVRRARLAAELAAELASVYRMVWSGEVHQREQPRLIQQVFVKQCVMLTHDELLAADVHHLQVEDAGGPIRMAMRVVTAVTGVSRYAMSGQRRTHEDSDSSSLLQVGSGG